jgi:hypothetical protein
MKGGLGAIGGGAQEIQIVIGCQRLFFYFLKMVLLGRILNTFLLLYIKLTQQSLL